MRARVRESAPNRQKRRSLNFDGNGLGFDASSRRDQRMRGATFSG